MAHLTTLRRFMCVVAALSLLAAPAAHSHAATPKKTKPTARKAPASRPASTPVSPPSRRAKSLSLKGATKASPQAPGRVLGKLPPMFKTPQQRSDALRLSQRRLTVDLYRLLAKKPGNVVFSPHSIGLALSMVYAGARGKTAVELYRALRLVLGGRLLHMANGEQLAQMQPPPAPASKSGAKPPPPPFSLSVANRMWGQKGLPFHADFRQTLSGFYGASFAQLNFKNANAARSAINKWIAQATQQKIKQLLGPGSITPATRLILTNAIYFKSAWKDRFYKRQTKPRDFWVTPKQKRSVATMHQKNWFSHKTTKHAHVVRLDYSGHVLSMYLVIPKAKGGLKAIAAKLSHQKVKGWFKGLQRRYLSLYLPKFKFESKFSMRSVLQKLGIKTAFTKKANFTGISKRKLQLGDVVHQACLDVHEKGTEAAAATAVKFFLTGMPIKPPMAIQIKADRPFLYVIRHQRTGALLFMGRISKP